MQREARLKQKKLGQGLVAGFLFVLVSFISPVYSATGAKVTLNFNGTDINAVIAAVSEMTGRNFIVDPRVKGKVTVISHRGLSSSEIYKVFLSVLKVHGFAAIPGKNVTKIVPEVNAKQDSIKTGSEYIPNSDEFITQVIEIKNVDAAQLVPILRPLVPQRGHLAAYPSSNVLVVSDSAANIRRLKQIVKSIDLASGDEIEVIPLKNASAGEVVRIITQLSSKDPKNKKDNLVADERSNSILLGGNNASRLRIKALIAHLDTPVDVGGSTQVVYLRNAVAKDLVPVLTGVSKTVASGKKGAKTPVTAAGNISIQADENTNALVITAPPDVFRSLRSVIRQLDVRRAQVLVEAVIAEVSTDASKEFGIQWGVGSEKEGVAGLVNFSVGGVGISGLANATSAPDGLSIGAGNPSSTTNPIGALVRALSSDSNNNILSTPSLMTLDNEEAEIVVGQNVPFITGSYSGTGGGSTPTNPFQTVQREDVGLTLRITPQINEGDAIRMKVEQEVSTVTGSSQGVDIITNKRSIKTNVVVDDGQMIALGGLIQEELRETEQRVPGLGDVPLLGWFFRYNSTGVVKTNLTVFLQPTIMKDAAVTAAATGNKYNYIRAKQLEMRNEKLRLADEEDSPLLKENKQFLTLPPPYNESEGSMEKETEDSQSTISTEPPTMESTDKKQVVLNDAADGSE